MRNGSPEEVRRVSGEIDVLRQDLGSLVSELDRRRREMLDVRLQMRRHPVVVVAAAATAAGGAAGTAIARHLARLVVTRAAPLGR